MTSAAAVDNIVRIDPEALDVAGRHRTLTVVSPRDPMATRPIVLVFHGSGQSAAKFRRFTGNALDRFAGQSGAVVAYPDGYRAHWNDARVSADFATRREGYDDVAFTAAIIDLLADRYHGDAQHVFAIGYSNGGQLVIRLIHEAADRLHGAALLSATQPAPENFRIGTLRTDAVPVVLFHGTKDPLVPYAGGVASLWGLRPRGLGISAPATADYFARRNRISTSPISTRLPGRRHRMYAERLDYRQDERHPVTLYTIHGAGHTVPGTRTAPLLMGRTYPELDAVAEIQRFFGLPTAAG